jgi:hypothetical protein
MLRKEKERLNCKTKMRLVTKANIHRERKEEESIKEQKRRKQMNIERKKLRAHKRTEKTEKDCD